MKTKLFLGIAMLFSVTIGSYASTEETGATRWNTQICRTTNPIGQSVWGSQCITPDKKGPCTRTTDCEAPHM